MTIKLKRLFAIFGVLFLLAISAVQPAIAQDAGTGSGLQISPVRSEYSILSGASETLTISLKNTTQGTLIARPSINDFSSNQDSGTPQLETDLTKPRNSASIAEFVQGAVDIELGPEETKETTLTIAIPEGQPSSAYYGAIRYSAIPKALAESSSGGAQVALTASVATLVLVEVPGNITEQIEVTSVKAYKDDNSSLIFFAKPNKVGVTIKNLGTGFAKPFGNVAVKNTLGKEVDKYELNNTNPRGNILPNSSRTFTDDIQGVSLPGRYTVTATVSHGRGGDVLIYSTSFWYLPLWFIIVLIGIVALLVAGGVYLYRRHGKKKLNSRRGR